MDFIPGYIRRMHGEEPVDYRHPLLEPIFKETYGYPVYQEQLMSAAIQLAGYTPPEADDLRKAIAKKIADKLHKHEQKFVAGAVERGIARETAAAIFKDWEEFARYGFNKSHAADYGVIAVQTAYLKLHYPVEYMTALLCVNQSDTDKVALYVADCRRMGIPVEPPDINTSGWDFSLEDRPDGKSAIRFGMGAIKNVGRAPVEAILKARGNRPFSDINDLARRVDLRGVGKRTLESLIQVGALDSFGGRAALRFARTLNGWGTTVRLVAIVDAYGKDPYTVPSNVLAAANWFQRDHLFIKGAPELRAEDPSRTRILFNRKVSYKGRRGEIEIDEQSRLQTFFMDEHLLMEFDMPLWREVEEMVIAAARGRD
jgi:hypothetical protein